MTVYETSDKDFMSSLNELLAPADTVLDIGSGIGVREQYACGFIVALDVHRPFLENRVFKSTYTTGSCKC